ncbi:MAG TPA: methyltransferase domain-containing protein [Microlunatus sp.]
MITSLARVVDLLRCPRCHASFSWDERALCCGQGHTFDIARQGYVNLTGAAQPAHADTAPMVAARSELLDSGRYAAVVDALITTLPTDVPEILDVGTGTGHYAAAALQARPGARSLGLDVSVAACRRAARAHPRLAVVTADVWVRLPVVDAGVDVVLSVFSPRNVEEFARVLRPHGCVITVTPGPDHLDELRSTFGLLGVESDKERRLTDTFGRAGLSTSQQWRVEVHDPWTADDAIRSIMMGPNAFHSRSAEIRAAAGRLSWPRPVTVSCVITRWTR